MRIQSAKERHRLASKRYNQNNVKVYTIQLNKKTDADIIEYLGTIPNKNGYFKQLIRDDM